MYELYALIPQDYMYQAVCILVNDVFVFLRLKKHFMFLHKLRPRLPQT